MEGTTRGELAKQTGLSMAAIRYYEERGLLPAPRRVESGYRIYSDDYLVKIKFIKDAKSLGYSLKEIQEGLQMLSQDMDEELLKELVRNKIIEIDEKVKKLHDMQKMLSGLLETAQEDIQNYLRSFRTLDD